MVLLPPLRFGESRTDQAHGKHKGPVLHTLAHTCSSGPLPGGPSLPGAVGASGRPLGTRGAAGVGVFMGSLWLSRAPRPTLPLGWPPWGFWALRGGPEFPSQACPTAGTKPEPPAQWEGVPHQGAPHPGGLAAPRQAAADELDRRPRRRVLHGHRGDQVGRRAGPEGVGARCCATRPPHCPIHTGRSASCSRPPRPSARPAGPTSPSPCARARPCHCGRPHPRLSTTSPLSSRTRPPARPSDCRPRPDHACPPPAARIW